jgi:hypothetical protein
MTKLSKEPHVETLNIPIWGLEAGGEGGSNAGSRAYPYASGVQSRRVGDTGKLVE